MKPQDITQLISVSRPTIAPDGSFAVFATSRPDEVANRSVGQLWRTDFVGAPRRITRGVADAAPALSPDGTQIAFLRGVEKKGAQLFVVDANGGEAIQVTDVHGGVSGFEWAPDGASFVFAARVAENGRYGTVDGLGEAAEAPRKVTGFRWHANGLGYTVDRPSHLFVVPAPDLSAEPFYAPAPAVIADGAEKPKPQVIPAEPRQITTGEGKTYAGIAFTPDGSEVLTTVADVQPTTIDLTTTVVAVTVADGAERVVVAPEALLSVGDIAVAEDGTIALLAYSVGESRTDFVAPGMGLWVLDGATPRALTDTATIDLGEVGSHIVVVGDDFLVLNRTRGRVHALRVTRAGDVSTVIDGDVELGGLAAADTAAGLRIVATATSPDSFGELLVSDAEGTRTATNFGAGLRASGIVTPKELTITGRDGYPIHGWLAAPEGDGQHPVILMIHGGPYASYGVHVFDEVQTLVDAGYAVAFCNPRGSAGYGTAHGRSIRQAMGTVDFNDVIDFLEGAVASDARLDGERVGVMGGSYGGYLTAWVTTQDHRFAGAIVERGFLEPESFVGTSDIGSFFGIEYVGGTAEQIAAQSPYAHVDNVKTPTLVIHSELDFRCPLEQATRYYSKLKHNGVEAEMLIFPGENHELTRSGQPRHRLERFAAVLEWWDRVLPVTK
ncbi:S9 family peptidase [Microbacterium sp. NC79]|uniref:S9 family peptidase n=1 Tax=Microbacterium sp. NC79 TaxID=2851009 RepID=UPI001C2C8F89|nr:S9 family peptidase [Microbacterium sp. NC79]MBV0894881.1 S9 family peptidase [Microbacterium sp. NC79]